jgi:hypothetical protein
VSAALPPTPGPVSVTEAISDAIAHTQRFLFPPRLDRWLALGFVAFLDQCGREGSVSLPSPPGEWGSGKGPDVSSLPGWLGEHVGLVVLLAALALAVVVGVTALVVWLSSRGILMYADDVATGRSDVARPWREHRELAASLFAWRFALAIGLLLGILLLVIAGVAIVVALTRGSSRPAAGFALLALVPLLLALVAMAVVGGLASLVLRDFVAPLQLLYRTPCGPALRTFMGLLRQQPGAFIVYVLLKLVFTLLAAAVAVAACCVTCGCVILPVVGQTVLQPLFFFERAWSLQLLRRFGHDLTAGPAVTSFDTFPGTAEPGEA